MIQNPSRNNRKIDRTAAVTLEVPSGVADDIEAVLRSFAEEAELDTSLVVDHSGFLIAGISSIPDVDVDTIGTLVAGASGATEGLTGALGEAGKVESLHLGEDRLLYLKEVGERFILVGVSDSNIPAGILRDQANQVQDALTELLGKVKAIPMSLTKKKDQPKSPESPQPEPPRSLRQVEPQETPSPPNPPVELTRANGANGGNGNGDKSVRTVGGVLPHAIAAENPNHKGDAQPASETPPQPQAEPVSESAPETERVVRPAGIVENSPFEMDDGGSGDSSDGTVRANSTPVHLSVPEARRREAEAKKENGDDVDENSSSRYSFELG